MELRNVFVFLGKGDFNLPSGGDTYYRLFPVIVFTELFENSLPILISPGSNAAGQPHLHPSFLNHIQGFFQSGFGYLEEILLVVLRII